MSIPSAHFPCILDLFLNFRTSGLGLLEYLNWCEDLDMQPIMAVWSGERGSCLYDPFFLRYSAGFALGGTSLAETQLPPYIQQAIDQINFVIGDPATSEPGRF